MSSSEIKDVDRYTYQISWSEWKYEFEAICLEFPDLFAYASSYFDAMISIRKKVEAVIESIKYLGGELPVPGSIEPMPEITIEEFIEMGGDLEELEGIEVLRGAMTPAVDESTYSRAKDVLGCVEGTFVQPTRSGVIVRTCIFDSSVEYSPGDPVFICTMAFGQKVQHGNYTITNRADVLDPKYIGTFHAYVGNNFIDILIPVEYASN